MLIFGKAVHDWKEKAAYAQDKADNEYAKLHEVRCESIEDVEMAFAAMAALAADTKCIDFLYHATINLNPGERLTREQWMKAVNTLEKNLKLTGHHRVVFEHIKKDRQHYHIVWSRIPPGNDGPAVNMGNNYYIHQDTAKALEKEFGLTPAPTRGRNKSSKKKQEIDDKNSKIRVDPEIVTGDVTRIFKDSRTTKEFIRNLAKEGYTLCRAKNKSLVIVDRQGGYHGLMRRIEGAKLADLNRKFPGLDKVPLPSLNDVLKIRRPATGRSFKRAASTLGKRTRSHAPRAAGSSFSHRPTKSLAAIVAQARLRHQKPGKKSYPPPIMRKRRKDVGEKKFTPRPEIPEEEISYGRAEAAYQAEFNKWEGLIEAAASDPSLSKDQRRASVAALRLQQQAAANAARKRVLEEEKSIAKAARRAKRILLGIPEPPS